MEGEAKSGTLIRIMGKGREEGTPHETQCARKSGKECCAVPRRGRREGKESSRGAGPACIGCGL